MTVNFQVFTEIDASTFLLHLYVDSAEQLFPPAWFAELLYTKNHEVAQAWQEMPSPGGEIFASLKAVLEQHKPESLLERRQSVETAIKNAYDHERITFFKKHGTEVSWEQVMYRIKLLHSVRADLFPKDEKAAQVEFLLNLYSPANSFGFDSQHEVESLGLKSLDDLSELRATVGRFRLATRQKWLCVQILRSVTREFADIDLPLFIKSVTETLENSLRSRVPPAESTTLLS
ncbi:hypothetical protein CROQUDRAFT_308365 [Cronartium quercuum f. sp. fusiforme G11]|uniref:Uncharacterized protein n=1 Tax=Cronartium quercuum f. sp. fusiforme G11 TaxID=708437 RepID=A0A9P6NBR4_9BASI|nr:hypothetical protein CROQUDRAFT_308365 [Cronartium quercuum f. sp. fusiforme G11]